MKHSQEFIDWYNAEHGNVQSGDFNRHGTPNPVVSAYASHMSMMPSVVEDRYAEWLNG